MYEQKSLPWRSRLLRLLHLPYPELEESMLAAIERLNCGGQYTRQCREKERAKQEGWFKRHKHHHFSRMENDMKKAFRKSALYKLGWRLRRRLGGTETSMYLVLVKETPGTRRTLHLLLSYYDLNAFRKVCNGMQPNSLGKLLPYKYSALERVLDGL